MAFCYYPNYLVVQGGQAGVKDLQYSLEEGEGRAILYKEIQVPPQIL